MTAPTSSASRRGRNSASPTVPVPSAPTGRRRPGSAWRCASCATRTSPTTSTGPPTSPNSTGLRNRIPDVEPGARRPPVSHVPEGTKRLAPLRRLAGGGATHGLLGWRPPLGCLACRSSLLGCPLRRCPLLGRLARRSPLLGCLLGRSPLLGC